MNKRRILIVRRYLYAWRSYVFYVNETNYESAQFDYNVHSSNLCGHHFDQAILIELAAEF